MTGSNQMNRRRFIQLGTAGLATAGLATAGLGLSGCSPNKTESQPKNTGAGGRTRITMLGVFFLPAEVKAATDAVKAFNAQSKTVEVQYVQGSWNTITSKMTVGFSSGDVPDLFQFYDAGLVPWGQNGLLADLTKLLPAETVASINPGTLTALTSPQNGLLGLPFETETPLIYYNVDMLKQAKIAPATFESRWTWDQLREYALQLTNADNKVAGISADWRSDEVLFKNGLGWQGGAAPIVDNNGQYAITATDPGTRTSIEYLRSLFEDGSGDATGFDGDIFASFMSGKTAMLIRGAWARTQLPDVKGAKNIQWAAMPFVKGPTDNLGSGAAQTLSIPKVAKHPEAAAEFLAWWAKAKNVATICAASGQVPPSPEALTVLRSSVGNKNFWPAALATAEELKGQPYCPGWLPMLGKVWNPAMFSYLQGKSSFDAFAQQVATAGTADVQTAAGNQ